MSSNSTSSSNQSDISNLSAISNYSFALRPEDHQPSGFCDFNRIYNNLNLYVTSPSSNELIYVGRATEISKQIELENLTDKIVSSNDILDCDICFVNKSNIITDCTHQYCKSCLNQWFNQNKKDSCPCCRNKLSNDKLFNLKSC